MPLSVLEETGSHSPTNSCIMSAPPSVVSLILHYKITQGLKVAEQNFKFKLTYLLYLNYVIKQGSYQTSFSISDKIKARVLDTTS